MKRLTRKYKETYFTSRSKMPVDYSSTLNACIGGEVLNKLGMLEDLIEDLEEELGTDLIKLFKPRKDGYYILTDMGGKIAKPVFIKYQPIDDLLKETQNKIDTKEEKELER